MGKSTDHMNLNQISTKFPFHAPESYFDDLPMKIMDKVRAESISTRKSIFIQYLKPVGFVAGFLIILGLIYFSINILPLGKSRSVQSVSQVFDEEFFISYPLSDQTIFEILDNTLTDKAFNNDQLESVLLASVTEYDLIDLNN
jgi:hypothetical protein